MLLQLILSGVAQGSIYALVALGMTVVGYRQFAPVRTPNTISNIATLKRYLNEIRAS